MTRVKICGVRTPEDALMCARSGADAVGMLVNVKLSPRMIDIDTARSIAAVLPPFVSPVIVMMPHTVEEAVVAAEKIRPYAIQLQGEEPPEMLESMRESLSGIKLIKAVHVGAGGEAESARRYETVADALLLDTVSPSKGGSGIVHDWNVSRRIVASSKVPVILAGGLSPDNVGEAVRALRPYAVDVASGVEEKGKPGIKIESKVKDFIMIAKGAQHAR